MSDDHREELFSHYQRELGFLRRMGGVFARTYPKVAARLELANHESPDPHVERLIESFAFLTGRIQANIDAEFPQIPQALLGALYPQFTEPVPSMAIARFNVDPERGKLTSGYQVAKGTQVFATAPNGVTCRFRTGYETTLWPLKVSEAGFQSTDGYDFLDMRNDVDSVLKLSVETVADEISDLQVDRLRFFLNGDRVTTDMLYELLFVHAVGVALVSDDDVRTATSLPASAIRPVGFERDETVLAVPDHSQPAYHLLREYFCFPEKFLYFDVEGLNRAQASGRLDILILLNARPRRRVSVDADNFALHTTPIVNLFAKTSEPVRIDGKRLEYKVTGDLRRERSTEVHSVLKVTGANQPHADAFTVEPYFSFNHAAETRESRAFWIARRDATENASQRGTDLWLSFTDLDFRPTQPAVTTLFAHTLCTNRGLAEQLPVGARLEVEEGMPVDTIEALTKPTPQISPPIEGDTLWRLVSHLSVNFLSLSQFDGSLKALQEILRLYAPKHDPATEQQIRGIVKMDCRRAIQRMGDDAWRGFARGVDVQLTLDEKAYVGSNAILLASVLNRFLSLYASINSFAQLTVRSEQRQGIWKQWPPRAGDQYLL